MVFISRKAAWRAAVRMVARGFADSYSIHFRLSREADRSCSAGYRVALHKAGRFVGYA